MNLLEILLNCNDDIFATVSEARKAVMQGEWMKASKLLGYASEYGTSELHDTCSKLSDEFYKKASQ